MGNGGGDGVGKNSPCLARRHLHPYLQRYFRSPFPNLESSELFSYLTLPTLIRHSV